MATKLDKLLSIRTRIIGDFEHHVTEAEKFTEASNSALVSFRSIALEKSYKEFIDIGEELEKMTAYHELENLQTIITKNRAIQDSYLGIKLHILPFLQTDASTAGLNASFFDTSHRSFIECNEKTIAPNQSNRLGLKLPHIHITPFDGKFEDWLEFKETFKSIMKRYNGEESEKFVHLKSFLRGEALDTVKHLKPNNQSYEEAWVLLIEQFQNKNAIVEAHIATLMNLPTIVKQFPSTLSQASTTTKGCLAALKSFEIMTETWDPIVVFILKQKLGPELRSKWEEERKGSHECATLKEFLQFLDTWRKIMVNTPQKSIFKPNAHDFKQRNTKTFVQTEGGTSIETDDKSNTMLLEKPSFEDANNDDDVDAHVMYSRNEICGVCDSNHRVFQCPKLINNPREALRFAQEKQLCTNCLYSHTLSECRSNGTCKKCHQRHHTLLHESLGGANLFNTMQTDQVMHVHPGITRVMLATALIPVCAHNGEKVWLRALIDQGSTASLISERGAQLIKCGRRKITGIPMLGVGDVLTGTARFITTITIGSMYEPDFELSITTLITQHISTIRPITRESIRQWSHIKNLQLADPSYTQRKDIDLLIGALPCAQIIQKGLIKGKENEPIAQQTHLGWILSGADTTQNSTHSNVMHNHADFEHFFITNTELSDQIKAFWEVEEIADTVKWSDEEKACDDYFTSSIKRAQDGKFIMRIPFKTDPTAPNFLGDSLENAKKRFYQLERRFARNPKLKEEYAKGIQEYITLGHAVRKPIEQACHVIPHHAVIKETSSTTKLRTVYDASAKTSNGYSLNDRMHIGPTISLDLWSVFMHWRLRQIALVADIEKMYRQFWVHEDDSKFLQILWRDEPTDPFELIELRTVTFGTAAAPYMTINGLHLIAEAVAKEYPDIAYSILKSFYVDDYGESFDALSHANQHKTQLTNTLAEYGLNLRKWNSNAEEFRSNEMVMMNTHPTTQCTTLGMQWNTNDDQISYKISLDKKIPRITKRTTLSEIASLFDPLGLLAPIIMQAKAFMQKLWLAKIDWDEELSPNLKEEWRKIRITLTRCAQINIPRWIGYATDNQHVSLHGLCDASEQMYAAACYLRTAQKNGTVEVNLVAAKTRVAPLKSMTIPRLELCAAKLLAKLIEATRKALDIAEIEIYAWSDSAVTLAWISTPPYKLKTFVSTRVKEIQERVPPEKWRYVKTSVNPADYATRVGVELVTLNRWWNGPPFLLDPPEKWPKIPEHMISNKHTPEMKVKIMTICEEKEEENFFLELYPTLDRLLKITAICLRWIKKYRHFKNGTVVSLNEIENAKKVWIRYEQDKYYGREINLIRQDKVLPAKSTILSLSPMLDEDGLLRVRGRLKHALLPVAAKHPIILPTKSTFTKLSIRQAHFKALHGGLQLTLRTIRDEYWIVRGKQEVKTHISKCVTCYRDKCTPAQQQMADLLAPQVQPDFTFNHTGVDFAGHFDVKTTIRRNAGTHKCYVALFICLTTKAIHLELARDLSTQAFIDALTRFVGRRGIPSRMYSDRGTNFIGAANELPNLWYDTESKESQEIQRECTRIGIDWHFNPARASHFGGLWEAGVKSMKTHLHRVLKDRKLTFEDFNTLIIQIEACLNSRPLCPISNDPNDLEVLTPGHFTIGRAPLTLPHPNLIDIEMSRLTRYQFHQQLYQSFWEQWSRDYLTRLRQRPKWKQQHPNLKIGQIVVIKEDNVAPTKWILGRITETFTGQDGKVRSAKLICKGDPPITKGKTGKAPITISRPIHKLCLLPIEDNMNIDERLLYDKSLIRGEDVDEQLNAVK